MSYFRIYRILQAHVLETVVLLLFFLFLCSSFSQAFAESSEPQSVKIDAQSFPDDAFRTYVECSVDKNQDGELSSAEIKAVRKVDLSETASLKDLTGIELFPELTVIDCSYTSLSSVDVSGNARLRELHAYETDLESIDVTCNPELRRLDLNNTHIGSIDVTNNPELFALNLEDTGITQIDVSNNQELYEIYLTNDRISSLDITNNPKLGHVRVAGTDLTELDLSGNPELMALYMMDTRIRRIDLSCVPELYYLTAWGSDLETLDLSNNAELNTVEVWGTNINCLDVTHCTKLKGLDIHGTDVSNLDLSCCPELQRLDISRTCINKLDLSNIKSLRRISWSNTAIGNLDLGRFKSLIDIECENAGVSKLDLSGLKDLHYLKCGGNALTEVVLHPDADMWLQDLGEQIVTVDCTSALNGVRSFYITPYASAYLKPSDQKGWSLNRQSGKIKVNDKKLRAIKYFLDIGNGKAGTDVDPIMQVTIVLRTSKTDKVPSCKISKLKALRRGMIVKLTRKKCSGYQIQYSRHKSFRKAKTVTLKISKKPSRKIKKLKSGKRYYVRARCFCIVDGKRYYGKYSKVRKIKIR